MPRIVVDTVSVLLSWLLLAALAQAQNVQPVPPLSARVIDQTGTLSSIEQQALEQRLAEFEQTNGTQIVILMIPSSLPEDIASYANRVANDWKIGRAAVGDGLLIVVAKKDRRMRIEVAKSLEGAVPDIAAARIIDEYMAPHFRAGNFAEGFNAALDRIFDLIKGEDLPPPEESPSQRINAPQIDLPGLGMFTVFATLFIGPALRRQFGKVTGPALTGGVTGVLAFLITASFVVAIFAGLLALAFSFFSALAPMRRHGPIYVPGDYASFPRHRGGGGGGFSSGGGGNFGGGGASGSW